MFRFGHSLYNNGYGGGAPAVDNDFVIRVKTDNAGTSASNQFTLGFIDGSSYIYNCTIKHGDGNETVVSGRSGPVTLNYASSGVYTITISGVMPYIGYNNGGDVKKLIEMANIGNVGILGLSFHGATNMVMNTNCTGNLSGVTIAYRMFKDCPLGFFPDIDMSSCTNFDQTFRGCGVFSDFKLRNFYAMNNGLFCFLSTTLPTSDYSDILITQNANNPNNSVTFHGGSSNYNASATSARTNLVSVKSWTITDAGLV